MIEKNEKLVGKCLISENFSFRAISMQLLKFYFSPILKIFCNFLLK